jgi:hypothetical protein
VGGIIAVVIGVALTTFGVWGVVTTMVAPGALLITLGSAYLGVHFARTGIPLIPPAMKSDVDARDA